MTQEQARQMAQEAANRYGRKFAVYMLREKSYTYASQSWMMGSSYEVLEWVYPNV